MKKQVYRKVTKKIRAFKVQNKVVQDATAIELVFPNISDNDAINTGALAEVNGKPATGEYVMPDGRVFVFTGGKLTKIIPEEIALFNYRPSSVSKSVFAIGVNMAKKVHLITSNTNRKIDRAAGARAWLESTKKNNNKQ